ncbi:pyrroline-5-carboxylate reductase [Facilibium subflavum]|uniref:pyrroline-5-carboxylate reductase n=1 Tax=Facilibium subflavum TaxID=2219058 RepID=UPI000E652CE6|nr:pyrroline-5-carboxylate reductase [Facilibium subflavum]
MVNAQICFLGGGNMTASILSGLVNDGIHPSAITVVDRHQEKLCYLQQSYKINISTDAAEAVQQADVIVLAVKPQAMDELTQSIKPVVQKKSGQLFISIAAGVPIKQFAYWLGERVAMVRAMPNTPALIGCGATALYANEQVSRQQKEIAEQILRRTGTVIWLDNESLMDTVTAISGSGPAYFFLMMEYMIEAGMQHGLTEKQATLLTTQTAFGASKMALESTSKISQLRRNVTSKGGVTAAALKAFEDSGFKEAIDAAISANLARSSSLSKMFDKALAYQEKMK